MPSWSRSSRMPLLGGVARRRRSRPLCPGAGWRSRAGRRRAAARRRRARRGRPSRPRGRSGRRRCWVARAWTRKRSGRSSRPPLDSKKSKTGAVPAIARTPEGLRTSTASGMLATLPAACRRGWRSAARRSPGRRRTRPLRPDRRCGLSRRSPPASPAPGTRPAPGSARPPRRPRRGGAGRGFSAPPWRGTACWLDLAVRLCLWRWWHAQKTPHTHRQRRTFGLAGCSRKIRYDPTAIYPKRPAIGRSLVHQARNRAAAASIRSSACSRPSTASDSKIPGETEVPVIATRIGW